LLSVMLLSVVANLDTAHRYLSRVEQGWSLVGLSAMAAMLPLALLLPREWLQRTWKVLAIAAIGICVFSWSRIPVESLRVDRWELMSNFLHRLFDGEYPYLASSRFNIPPPVPFPWLYLLSIPAWLMGEIGLFPFASLAILVWATPSRHRYMLVWALVTSLPVWYEVAVRSNIVANAALVGAFLQTRVDETRRKLVVSAIMGGVILCTRASFVSPVMLWMGSVFLAPHPKRWKDGWLWGAVAGFVTMLPFALLIVVWGWPVFRDCNPLRFAGALQSPWFPLTILVMSPWIGASIKSIEDRFLVAYLLVLAPMLTLLLPTVTEGLWRNINRGYFEVAFWNSALVLGLVALAMNRTSKDDRN
jgi:hypothetical protein